jgi:hypothetical protein
MLTNMESGNLKGRCCLGDIGVDGKIILKWIINKQGVRM